MLINTPKTLFPLLTSLTIILMASPSHSQPISYGCYIETEYGELLDLSRICGQNDNKSDILPSQQSVDEIEKQKTTPTTTAPSPGNISTNPNANTGETNSTTQNNQPQQSDSSTSPTERKLPVLQKQE